MPRGLDLMGISVYGGSTTPDEVECGVCKQSIFARESSVRGFVFIGFHYQFCVKPYDKARDRHERKVQKNARRHSDN